MIPPNTQIEHLLDNIAKLKTALAQREAELTTVGQEIERLRQQLDTSHSAQERLHQRLTERISELDQARAANDNLKKAIANLKTQRTHLTEALGHCAAVHLLRNQAS